METVVRRHSVLNSPLMVSISALSKTSPTLPIEGLMLSTVRWWVKCTDVFCQPASE
jgi:hypothetical protein